MQIVEVQQLFLALLLSFLFSNLELNDLAEEVTQRLDVLIACLRKEKIETLDNDFIHYVTTAEELSNQFDVANDFLFLLVLDLLLVKDKQHALREVSLIVAHAILIEFLVALLH